MLCQLCHKNEATIEFTEIINNQMMQLHLCEECAHQKGIEMEQPFSIADFLAGMGDLTQVPETKKTPVKCPRCNMTMDDFRKIGRFGCGECYNAFKASLLPLLKRIHGAVRHTGKAKTGMSGAAVKTTALMALRQKLQRAIDNEEFEEAANIRDKIRELEKKAKAKE